MPEATRPCPYCAETIKAEASLCHYCGRHLSGRTRTAVRTRPFAKSADIRATIGMGLLTIAIAWVITAFYYLAQLEPPSANPPRQAATTHQVEYRLGGTAARASITYANAEGGTEQSAVSLPFTTTFAVASGEFLYLSAQREGGAGSIVCEIWLDGALWKTSQSNSAYVIATCSGMAGVD